MVNHNLKTAKVAKSYIQSLVDAGVAKDLSTLSDASFHAVSADLAIIAYAQGAHGTTSALFVHVQHGLLYATV